MTEKNLKKAEIAEKDAIAAAEDTVAAEDIATAKGRDLKTERKDGTESGHAPQKDGDETPIIFLDDVHVVFKTRTGSLLHPNKVHAVNGLSLKLMPGETIGIVGESGCGKSTTANVMCGLQTPTSGHVYF